MLKFRYALSRAANAARYYATLEGSVFAEVLKQGLLMPMDLTLGKGDFQLRLAVRDNRTGFIGTLGIPVRLM